MTCFVKDCTNIRRLIPPEWGISFFRFPRDKASFTKWLKIIGRNDSNIVWSRNRYICSQHFQPSDIIKLNNCSRLDSNALPCLRLETDSFDSQVPYKTEDCDPLLLPDEFSSSTSETYITNTPLISYSLEDNYIFESPSPSTSCCESLSVPGLPFNTSSTTKRTAQFVEAIHNYSASPRKLKRQVDLLKAEVHDLKRIIYNINRTKERLKEKLSTQNEVIVDLKRRGCISKNGELCH